MKLPGTYYAYAAGMAVFGQTVTGVHLTLLVVNGLTAVFVLLLGRKLFGTMAGNALVWRKLCHHVGQPGGAGSGGTCHPVCDAIRGAGNIAALSGM